MIQIALQATHFSASGEIMGARAISFMLGRVARTGLACPKATALMALAALEVVMGELP
jgi:hypothetical protein